MLLELRERMKMGEEGWSFVLKGGCVWVIHISNTRVCIVHKDCKGPRWSGGKEHDRPGAGEEE